MSVRIEDLKVSDLEKKTVLSIERSSSICSALQKLFEAGILSAPVLDTDGTICGFLDLIDVVVFALCLASSAEDVRVVFDVSPTPEMMEKVKLIEAEAEEKGSVSLTSVDLLVNLSGRNAAVTCGVDERLTTLLALLSKHHRVAIVDQDGKLCNYVTQSDAIRFLVSSGVLVGPLTLEMLTTIPVGSRPVSITTKDRAIDAFKQIAFTRCGSCAVVDENGKLVGNISSPDIRIHACNSPSDLIDILCSPYETWAFADSNPSGFLAVTKESRLDELLKQLAAQKRHHCYIVDSEGKPEMAISLGDILRLLTQD